jgi:hypothetical protein
MSDYQHFSIAVADRGKTVRNPCIEVRRIPWLQSVNFVLENQV